MTSRLRLFAAFLVVSPLLFPVAPPAQAGLRGIKAPNGQTLFEFGLLGSGALNNPCTPEFGTCTLTAGVNGNVIGPGSTLSETITWSNESAIVSAGATCYSATGTGTIVTKVKDEIDFTFNGLLCGNGESFAPSALNATYIVTGGTGRFATSVGSGNFTQNNLDVSNGATGHPKGSVVGSNSAAIVRFDGTLTKGRPSKPQPRA